MTASRRKSRRPAPEQSEILVLRTKESGPIHPFLRFTMGDYKLFVETYATNIPQVRVWIQNGSTGGSVILDEEEVGRLVNGLLDALKSAKATVASREGGEAGDSGHVRAITRPG